MLPAGQRLLVEGLLLLFPLNTTFFFEPLADFGVLDDVHRRCLCASVCGVILALAVLVYVCRVELLLLFLRFGLDLADEAEKQTPLDERCSSVSVGREVRWTHVVPDEERIVLWKRRRPGSTRLERSCGLMKAIDAIERPGCAYQLHSSIQRKEKRENVRIDIRPPGVLQLLPLLIPLQPDLLSVGQDRRLAHLLALVFHPFVRRQAVA